jgi:Carboxypeptidase regulatory-like domain
MIRNFKNILATASIPLLLFVAAPANPCSMASCLDKGVEMHKHFVVRVTHDEKPLSGVSVRITVSSEKETRTVFFGATADGGSVQVQNLPAGEYWINTELLGISAGSQCFHVLRHASKKAERAFNFEWGDDYSPSISMMAGRLIDSRQRGTKHNSLWNITHPVEFPIGGATLRLQQPLTHTSYSTNSDQNGSFTFVDVPPGIYVLHVDGGRTSEGSDYESTDQLIDLAASPPRSGLQLRWSDASGGSCGGVSLEVH